MSERSPWLRHYDPGVPAQVADAGLTLPELLDATASRHPEGIALRYFLAPRLPVATLSWAGLRAQSLRFATALARMGVGKGDRVALMLPNLPQAVSAMFGALRLGAVVVQTNPMYVAREMREQFQDAGCETVVILDQLLPRLEAIRAETGVRHTIVVDPTSPLPWPGRLLARAARAWHGERPRVSPGPGVHLFEELMVACPPAPPAADVRPADLALLQYTGGTTGTPKGAMLTHANLVSNSLQAAAWFPRAQEGRERILGAAPLFHVYGLTTVLLMGVVLAAEIVLIPRPRPVDLVLAALQRFRPTIFPGVPTLYAAINEHPRARRYDLRSGTLCLSGAAPLPREVAERFEALTGGRLVEGYGLTEASPLTHGTPIHGTRKTGSVGVPVSGTDARVVDLETGEPLPTGGKGELEVRGPQVMSGYWQRPLETAAAFHDGWLRTGDVARMDEDGFFFVVDRRKDMIDASGFKVFPREVEEVLLMHPKLREACVAGVPDRYRGETVKAFVVLRPGQSATAEEIVAFCRIHLAAFKVPRLVEFREELPKSLVGKPLRRLLVAAEPSAPAPRG